MADDMLPVCLGARKRPIFRRSFFLYRAADLFDTEDPLDFSAVNVIGVTVSFFSFPSFLPFFFVSISYSVFGFAPLLSGLVPLERVPLDFDFYDGRTDFTISSISRAFH